MIGYLTLITINYKEAMIKKKKITSLVTNQKVFRHTSEFDQENHFKKQ